MTEPKWLVEARKYDGLKEIPGARDNPTIVKWFADVGHSWVQDDETAWCAAFVGAMLEKVGIKSTRKLNARSYLEWGVPISKPAPGAIAVFYRGDPKGWQGHVSFYIRENANNVWCLGGNQSNQVNITRYPKSRLLGYRWPAGASTAEPVPVPPPAPAPTPVPDKPAVKPAEPKIHPVGFFNALMRLFRMLFRR